MITLAKAKECFHTLFRTSQFDDTLDWAPAMEWATQVIVNAFIPYGGYDITALYYLDLENVAAMFSVFWCNKDPNVNKIAWDELNRILAPLPLVGQDVSGSSPTFIQTPTQYGYARRTR